MQLLAGMRSDSYSQVADLYPDYFWTAIQYIELRFSQVYEGNSKREFNKGQGGITCGAIDEPRKYSKAIDERVIINFRDKNVVIARFLIYR